VTWLVIVALTAVAAAALLFPLMRRQGAEASRAAYDREVYRDQLAELERDKTRGIISETEAKSARAEIARRMLATERDDEIGEPPPRGARSFAMVAAVAAPILAVALYVATGSPEIPGMPLAARHAGESEGTAARSELTERIATLAQRLQQNPDDLEGWLLLARSLTALERHAEAATAWRQVMRLSGNDAEHAGELAESLVQSANGVVTPEARTALERVRAAQPFDPRALFYLGLAEAQAGNAAAALQLWTDLIAVSPENAPWLATVRARIRQTAAEARIDPATIKPSAAAAQIAEAAPRAPRGPSAADVEAMQRMSPEERQQAIRGMVEGLAARLEAQPNDPEGWRRLGRAWRTLGERDKAKAASAKAAELMPDRVDVLSDYAVALLDGVTGEDLPADFVAVMRRILALDPDHGDALWFTGLAEAQAGNKGAAAALWEKLLARLPGDSREHAEVKQRLDQLQSTN
jgi:cytochrome c-type biogenesis protein CcmH